ncbi:MAG: DUF1801 domain-containing protein [Polyangiaceae bacterium]|nr:DUF1801 domain-containing protein [Polyangiaceae bacterium]MCW5790011.1 DUF1801 domain-containing protein [Polyangiaceae bacterium]
MCGATGLEPKMWGSSIIGFGEYDYEYDSGRKGTMAAAGFSPRKAACVVYLMDGIASHEAALAKLGPHTSGVGCLYLKDLSEIDLELLKAIIQKSFKTLTAKTYGKRAAEVTVSTKTPSRSNQVTAAATKTPKRKATAAAMKTPKRAPREGATKAEKTTKAAPRTTKRASARAKKGNVSI